MARWMLFVDGENLTMRGQVVLPASGINLSIGKYYSPNVFLWIPNQEATWSSPCFDTLVPGNEAIRSFYYISVAGDYLEVASIREALWHLGFDPQVFKKPKRMHKAKGVDIALTKDMLSNAFLNNYDKAVLIAGDADYVPLIEEVKRLGKNVYVAFFAGEQAGLSPERRLASDRFLAIDECFSYGWSSWELVERSVSDEVQPLDVPSISTRDS